MISCWFHRKRIAAALDFDHPLAASTERHIAGCSECRQLYATEQALVARLTGERERDVVVPSSFLHGRIMANLRGSRPESSGWGWDVRLVALLGSVVLAGVFAFLALRTPPRQAATEMASPGGSPTTGTFELPRLTEMSGLNAQFEQPLEREMKLVANDTKNAIDLLAHNFLPEKFLVSRGE